MYIRARPPIRVVSPYSPACVCVCVDAARLGLFCVCWAISGPVQQVCAVYISAVARGQERANVNWAPGPGAVKRYLFLYFPFFHFFPQKRKEKTNVSRPEFYDRWGGFELGSRMMGGQARKKRRDGLWRDYLDDREERRASGGLLTDLLALFHPLTRARFSLAQLGLAKSLSLLLFVGAHQKYWRHGSSRGTQSSR